MSAAVGVAESFVARKAAGQTVKKVAEIQSLAIMYGSDLLSYIKRAEVFE